MTREPTVAAVVLAAGLSRRAGRRNKLLGDVGGRPMIAAVVATVLASRARPVIVVTGHEAALVRHALAGQPVEFVENADYPSGMAGSIGCGIGALPASATGVLICLGDMPEVAVTTLDRLIEAASVSADIDILVPVEADRRGNPVLFGRRWFDQLSRLDGDRGAKRLLDENPDRVADVVVDDSGIFVDYDGNGE